MSQNLLEKKVSEIDRCEKAMGSKSYAAAIRHAAEVARISFQLARQTEGAVRQSHLEDAESWIEIGEKLKQKKQSAPKSSGGKKSSGGRGKSSSGKGGGAKGRSRKAVSTDGDEDDNEWQPEEKTNVSWDDIAGMEEAKATIKEMVVYPLQHPEKAAELGVNPGGGVLLFGPPGNGKTLLGKAIANELDCPFYYASGAKIRSKWSGEAEKRLSALIKTAQSEPLAILFFDEIEALLPRRGGGSVVDNRIVTQFLADVGGFEGSDNVLMILGATNKPWDIDEAVFRTGRFDEKIYIGPPDFPARRGILEMNLGEARLGDGIDFETLASRLEDYSGSDIAGIVNAAKRQALRRAIETDDENPQVELEDLQGGIEAIPSSITDKMIKQYEKFIEQRFN